MKDSMLFEFMRLKSNQLQLQIIAGLIEHRISDELSSQPLLVNMISFVVRVANSYFGTQVRIRPVLYYLFLTSLSPYSFKPLSSIIFWFILEYHYDFSFQLFSYKTQQWIDLARSTGLQTQKSVTVSNQIPEALSQSTVEYSTPEEASTDDLKNQ